MTAVFDTSSYKKRKLNLCRFANGKLKEGENGQLTTQLLSKSEGNVNSQEKKILVSESPFMTYTGQNFGKKCLNSGNKTMKYYVGVFDEKTRKIRVCDADLFQMNPYIPGQQEEEEALFVQQTVKPTEIKEKLSMLTEAFGSKRQKSALEKSRQNQLDNDALKQHLAADISHGKEHIKSRQQAASNQEPTSSVNDITPPCHKDAENVEDVYIFSDILTDFDLELLHGPAAVFFDSTDEQITTWRKESKYPKYILNHLSSMPLEPGLRWKRSKCLIYMHYMLSLFNTDRHGFKKKDLHPKECPTLIQKKLNDNFTKTANKLRCMPSRQKDRLACYILTLCLLIDEYNVTLTDLVVDMRMQHDKLFQILKLLGCRIMKKKTKDGTDYYNAKLKLPLDFPKKALFKQKGGRR